MFLNAEGAEVAESAENNGERRRRVNGEKRQRPEAPETCVSAAAIRHRVFGDLGLYPFLLFTFLRRFLLFSAVLFLSLRPLR